jgi:group I intron endonuclease
VLNLCYMQFNIPAEHKNASGVYIIRNTVNEKVYIGSAVNFRNRYIGHLGGLKKGSHHSTLLQRFIQKYGVEVLIFDVLELTDREKRAILECEQKWIDFYEAHNSGKGFNAAPVAGSSMGVKRSAEYRHKMSTTKKGSVMSEEARRKMSTAKSRRAISEETRRKTSTALIGHVVSEEARRKMSTARRGRVVSEETRRKTSESLKGRIVSEATQQKKSIAMKGRILGPLSAETRRKLSESLKGRVVSEETRSKISAARKRYFSSRKQGTETPTIQPTLF